MWFEKYSPQRQIKACSQHVKKVAIHKGSAREYFSKRFLYPYLLSFKTRFLSGKTIHLVANINSMLGSILYIASEISTLIHQSYQQIASAMVVWRKCTVRGKCTGNEPDDVMVGLKVTVQW